MTVERGYHHQLSPPLQQGSGWRWLAIAHMTASRGRRWLVVARQSDFALLFSPLFPGLICI